MFPEPWCKDLISLAAASVQCTMPPPKVAESETFLTMKKVI